MKWISCNGLLLVLVMVALTGCPDRSATHAPVSDVSRAQQLFAELCASCHGRDARGGAIGPDLTATRFKYGKNKVALEKSIFEGRPGGMPAFGSSLKQEDVALLADYMLVLP